MKLFTCDVCGQPLMFENTRCERCHHTLGYDVEADSMVALDPLDGLWRTASGSSDTRYRFCANADHGVCNWLVPAGADAAFCRACALNRTVPDLSDPVKLRLWREIEAAKHRLVYTLLHLGLPLPTRQDDPREGLAFDFKTDEGDDRVMTGHDEGLITLNAREADTPTRVKLREEMREPYRTLLGHFRHEVGHFYWDRLVRDDAGALERCRALFGDDRADYQAALRAHYEHGAPPDWRERTVSAYATMHPWEDFAETFAHFLHIVDSLDTASSFGMAVHARDTTAIDATAEIDPYGAGSMAGMLAVWTPLAFAANALNRSMGQPDLYPFVLPPPVIEKLEFIRALVLGRATRAEHARAA